MNSFYFDKMHMLCNQNKSCVKSCQKHCLKNALFSKKRIVFQHVHFLIPLFWNEKLSLMVNYKNSVYWKIRYADILFWNQQCRCIESWLYMFIRNSGYKEQILIVPMDSL